MDISVVMPTYNRSSALELTLDALGNQKTDGFKFEVIVVDDPYASSGLVALDRVVPEVGVDLDVFDAVDDLGELGVRQGLHRLAVGDVDDVGRHASVGCFELGLERLRLYVMKLQAVLNKEAGGAPASVRSSKRDDSAVWT